MGPLPVSTRPWVKEWWRDSTQAGASSSAAGLGWPDPPEPPEPVDTVPWRICLTTVKGRLPRNKDPFDGWPYLLTRIGGTPLRHLILLPAAWTTAHLRHFARRQAAVNWLPTCLVTGPAEAAYFSPQGLVEDRDTVPRGVATAELLAPVEPVPDSEELAVRRRALAAYRESRRGTGYLMGDGFEFGPEWTEKDVARYLVGPADAAPRGLARCPACEEVAGEFLARGEDPDQAATGLCYPSGKVSVYCRCENRNRCGACGQLLAPHRLGACYYNAATRWVTYFPAYQGLRHRCTTPASTRSP